LISGVNLDLRKVYLCPFNKSFPGYTNLASSMS
jgi:hypothetical protein